MVLDRNNTIFFKNKLNHLKTEHLFRQLRTVDVKSNRIVVDKKYRIINFSSNDYLGLSTNRDIINKLNETVKYYVSQCSSRLISGNSTVIQNLEETLSSHRCTESSLIFPTGYMANLGVLGCIADKETTIFSDELNHASIIDGCKLSNSKITVYPHNDISFLEKAVKKSHAKMKIIVTEGIFSMNGDFVKLKQISNISEDNKCILVIDDAHGDFVVGNNSNNYAGTPSYFNENKRVDIHISSLSKALGCFGGYISCSKLIQEYIINKSRPFIFTSALPDIFCILAEISIDYSKKRSLQKKLYRNIDYFHKIINESKVFNIKKIQNSPIIPIIIGSEKNTLEISKQLLKLGFFVQAIRYPTVKKNEARLRVSISAKHTYNQINNLISELTKIYKKI